MTSVTPWSVKGINPRAREVAKDLARRSGMTLGEWLTRVILDDEGPEDLTSQDEFAQRPARTYRSAAGAGGSPEDVARVLSAVDNLSERLEAAETRTGMAIIGVERSVRDAVARIEAGEREQVAVAARFEGAVNELNAGQTTLAERLRKYETDGSGPRSAEALRSLEQALGKVAGQLYDGESRTREILGGVEARVARLEAGGGDPALADHVTGRLNERLAEAEAKTSGALEGLRASFAALDSRLHSVEGGDTGPAELRFSDLAASLTSRVEAARAEIAEKLRTSADERFDEMERRIADLTQQVADAEERSARAIEDMGKEVLSIADTLNRRVEASETRGAEAIEQAGGEMARIATAMEARLGRTETLHAEALQRLGDQIATVTERLGDRIASAERRSAEAMDDVGEKLDRTAQKLATRQELTSEVITERILMSEERTARLLEGALDREEEAPEASQAPAAAPAAPVRSSFSPFSIAGFDDLGPSEQRAEPAFETPPMAAFPAETLAAEPVEPAFSEEDFDAADGFEPVAPVDAPTTRSYAAESAGASSASTFLPEPPLAHAEPEFPTPDAAKHLYVDDAETAEDDFESALFGEPAAKPAAQGFLRQTAAFPDDDEESYAAETEFLSPVAERAEPQSGAERSEGEAFEDALFVDELDALPEPAPTAPQMADEELGVPALEPERPLTTRELIEQARAAARATTAAAAEKGKKASAKAGASSRTLTGTLFSGFGVPKRPKRSAGTLQTALLVAGGAAFLSVGAAGLVVMGAKPGGEAPKRVAENRGDGDLVAGAETDAGAVGAAPRASVAMAPQVIAVSPSPAGDAGPDMAAAYDTAVRALEAGEAGGVAGLRRTANLGYPPAQLYLATLYENGRGVVKDLSEARRWTERAAQGGDRKAMHNLALYAFEGVGGQPRNPALAAQWFRRAADLGLTDSQYNLGRLYEQGLGVAANPAEAYKWYLIAARSGDDESRQSAERIRVALSADAQAVARRAASGYRSAADTASSNAASPAVVIAQRALSRLGYYQGPRDGSASPALNMAVAAYQREQGLPATGALDDATVSKLVVFTR